MRISVATGSVDARHWKTFAQMSAYIGLFKANIILGRASTETSVGSFVCQGGPAEDPGSDVAVGLVWTPGTFEPQMLVLDNDADDLIAVGFDNEVVGIARRTLQVNFRIELKTYFRSMTYLKGIGILVFEEIGASLISLKGANLWNISRDVITDIKVERERELHLSFMDSPSLRVDVSTGTIIAELPRRH